MRRFSLALMFVLGASGAAAQEHKLDTKPKLLSGANSVFAGMCAQHQEAAKVATSVTAIRLSDHSVAVWCSCAPAEMSRLVAQLNEPIAREIALATYTRATSICTAKQWRQSVLAECPGAATAAKRQSPGAYCACIKSRLAAMTDEQLHADLAPAYEEVVRRDRERGTPTQFLEDFALQKYGEGCQTADFSENKESVLGTK